MGQGKCLKKERSDKGSCCSTCDVVEEMGGRMSGERSWFQTQL